MPVRGEARGVGTPALFALVAALVLSAGPARAVIEGSPHDLILQGYDTLKTTLGQDRCSRCHIPAASGQKGFLPDVPLSLQHGWGAASLGCFSCHDGTTIVSPAVDASRTAFHAGSHGNDLAGYAGLETESTGLPGLEGARMECTTCHDPHDNGRRPFLRAEISQLCLLCHSTLAEYGRGKENRTGNHVIPTDSALLALPEAPVSIDEPFRVPFPSPYPLNGGKSTAGVHWDLGGHLTEGNEGTISCVSCHAIHGDEEFDPLPGLLSRDPVREVADLFCEGCHAGERGDGAFSDAHPNPGGTTTGRTYHPVDDDEANKSGRIVEVVIPPAWPLGTGDPKRLLCSTCHVAHGARPETAILRPAAAAAPSATAAIATTFCESCHDTLTLPYHHPVGTTGGDCLPKVPPPQQGVEPGVYCEHCHRAHNAGLGSGREKDFVPLLRAETATVEACSPCHPAGNPTCEPREEYRASHFLGDSTLPETYGSIAPPQRLEPWPESGYPSLYGGLKNQVILCVSCHLFRSGAIVSGDKGTGRYLLARSGNDVEWVPGAAAGYLCTGCHGEVPGTGEGDKGHTHPLMNANVARLDHAVEPPVSATPNGMVNCDSCHRPHEARTAGGYYILETVDGPGTEPQTVHPKVDYTVVCHRCHDPGRY